MIKATFDLEKVIAENRGKKLCGFIDLAHKVDGSMARLPYMIVSGAEDGPVFVADCCLHGDEYEGAEAISQFYNNLDPAKVKGAFVGVPAANLEAFNAGQRTAPIDWSNQDMNRAFPGNPEGMLTMRIAHFYFENFVKKADYVVSFHGGGNGLYLEPLATYQDPDTPAGVTTLRMAKAIGVQVLWHHVHLPKNHTGTETITATNAGVPCICVELGGQGIRHEHRQEIIDLAERGLLGVMQEFGMAPGEPPYRDDYIDVEISYLHTDEGGYHHVLPKPLDLVKEGDVISEIVDIFGKKVGEVKAPFDGYVCGYWCYATIHPGHWAFLLGKPVEK